MTQNLRRALPSVSQGLADATQKLAAVEAREKVYTDSIEAQQKEMVTLSTQKMQVGRLRARVPPTQIARG